MNSHIVNCLGPQPEPSPATSPSRRHQPARACLVGLGRSPGIYASPPSLRTSSSAPFRARYADHQANHRSNRSYSALPKAWAVTSSVGHFKPSRVGHLRPSQPMRAPVSRAHDRCSSQVAQWVSEIQYRTVPMPSIRMICERKPLVPLQTGLMSTSSIVTVMANLPVMPR